MLKIKWDDQEFQIETADDCISIVWDAFGELQKLLGEAQRLADTSLEGEIEISDA